MSARRRKSNLIYFPVFVAFMFVIYILIFSYGEIKVVDIKWYPNTSRNTADYILPHQNTALIEPIGICGETDDSLLMVIAVLSAPENYLERLAIRETWGNTTFFNYHFVKQIHGESDGSYLKAKLSDWMDYADKDYSSTNLVNFKIKVVFVIGTMQAQTEDEIDKREIVQQNIYFEQYVYDDILQEDFIDSYYNLTLKSLFTFKWFNNRCHHKAKFLFKTDDDIFLNVPNLLQILLGGTTPIYKSAKFTFDKNYPLKKKNCVIYDEFLLLGLRYDEVNKHTNLEDKWYTPDYLYAGDTLPKYLKGSGYVLTSDTVRVLYEASLITPIFPYEDVFLTGIVAEVTNIEREHNPLFFRDYDKKNLCSLHGVILQHGLNSVEMREAFDFVTKKKNKCKIFNSWTPFLWIVSFFY